MVQNGGPVTKTVMTCGMMKPQRLTKPLRKRERSHISYVSYEFWRFDGYIISFAQFLIRFLINWSTHLLINAAASHSLSLCQAALSIRGVDGFWSFGIMMRKVSNYDGYTWMSRWKLGSPVSKWVVSPTYKWGILRLWPTDPNLLLASWGHLSTSEMLHITVPEIDSYLHMTGNSQLWNRTFSKPSGFLISMW